MPEVDVVIPTFNRHARLGATLRSLARQSFRDFRVIVADDCSTPPVAAERLPADVRDVLDVTVLRTQRNSGPAAARNLAIAAATGRFIAFIDDDVDANPDWLERLVAAARAHDHPVVIGPLLAPAGWRPTPWNAWEAHTLAREYGRMEAGVYAPTWRQFFTGNALARRDDLVAAGAFDERFTRAEDIELGVRLDARGCRFVFEARAIGWHHARRSLDSWLRIPRDYARFDVELDRLYPQWHWLATIDEEAKARRLPSRLLRSVAHGPATRVAVRTAAITAARVAFRVGGRGPALHALSLAYDLEYQAALAAARAGSDSAGNLPSTPPQPGVPTVTR